MSNTVSASRLLPARSRIANQVRELPGGASIVSVARAFFGNGDGDEQWQRTYMNNRTRELVHNLCPESLDVLEISGDRWSQLETYKSYQSAFYPEYDVCHNPLDQQFDLVIAEQVFEHLLWPYRAAKNVHEMLRPGGAFLISTPFLIRIHECPYDCTRWTETGMKHFLAEAGFSLESIVTYSWGNRRCLKGNLSRWQIYQSWRHSLKNDPRFPVQVWALARK